MAKTKPKNTSAEKGKSKSKHKSISSDPESEDSCLSVYERDDFLCPLTLEIFYFPVLAADGHLYEREALEKWFKENDTSPITGNKLESKSITPCYFVKNKVEKYLNKYPKKKKHQFKPDLTYLANKDKIYQFILNENHDRLLDYKEFDLPMLFKDFFDSKKHINLFKNVNVIKHIIDNSTNHNKASKQGWYPVHYIVRFSNIEIIQYFFESFKNLDLTVETTNNYNVASLLFSNQELPCIKWVIENYKIDIIYDEADDKNVFKQIKANKLIKEDDFVKFWIETNRKN